MMTIVSSSAHYEVGKNKWQNFLDNFSSALPPPKKFSPVRQWVLVTVLVNREGLTP